jgi:DNA-binding FrmR family transcriptional regulator
MSNQSSGPNRLSRLAAKEVPHRIESRLFAAKSAVTSATEDLMSTVRKAHVHEAVRTAFLQAAQRVEQRLHDITVQTEGATSAVKDLGKEVKHLELAEKWVAASGRVMERLGDNGGKAVMAKLEELQEQVLWLVRADHWDGQLTAAVKRLQKATQDAEAKASRAG